MNIASIHNSFLKDFWEHWKQGNLGLKFCLLKENEMIALFQISSLYVMLPQKILPTLKKKIIFSVPSLLYYSFHLFVFCTCFSTFQNFFLHRKISTPNIIETGNQCLSFGVSMHSFLGSLVISLCTCSVTGIIMKWLFPVALANLQNICFIHNSHIKFCHE